VRSTGRFTFPGPLDRVVIEAMCPHLQWRNRAGFAPDFPVMPLAGTQGRRRLYHPAVLARKRVSEPGWIRRRKRL